MRVVVEDGLIHRIGTASGPAGPREARVIDCQGRTLMPGLLDAHVHLALLDLDPAAEAAIPPAVLALRIKNEIEATLEAGFTTVRDAGGLDWGFKEAIRLGLIRGPRIFISGAFISQTGGHGDHRARTSRGNFLDEATADQMLAAGDVFLVPTIITYELLSAREAGDGWTPDMVRKIRQGLTGAYDSLGLAYEKGLRIGSGSDVLAEMQGNKGKEIACQARVMGAMQAIIAATRTNAALMPVEKEAGTVGAGTRADLIVLDTETLQDPAIFGDPKHVRLVMLGGDLVKDLD